MLASRFTNHDIKEGLKILIREPKQSSIFKVEVEHLHNWNTICYQFLHFLITEKSLAGAPHTDNHISLARYLHKFVIPSNQCGQFPFMEIINKLSDYCFHNQYYLFFLGKTVKRFQNALRFLLKNYISKRDNVS